MALLYTGYLLYVGIPVFLNIDRDESMRFSGSTLAIGVLVFEVLLALTATFLVGNKTSTGWSFGPRFFNARKQST